MSLLDRQESCVFSAKLREEGLTLRRTSPKVLQLNLGKLCNLTCVHCHVNAGPNRKEIMDAATIDRVIDWQASAGLQTVDLTGGAPEMNPDFRRLIDALRKIDPKGRIIDRCNLSILLQPGFEDLAEFLADRRVEIVASLPCYELENVDQQRGEGVYDESIHALKLLNDLGYGSSPDLELNLVYNPAGPTLPPDQTSLESDYKEALRDRFGLIFNKLFTITNMPIARFRTLLSRAGRLDEYNELLLSSFNRGTIDGLMCRDTLSVDWQGRLFDCDFNQMLNLPLGGEGDIFLWDCDPNSLVGEPVRVDGHCFGCTAGAGSSCCGSLEDKESGPG